jgi:hypothetical protein
MPAKKEISLLPDEENINSLSSRIIRYLTTVGRYIIVFTELIVIGAFLSRFWLDRKNSDLSEVIRQQKAIMQSTGNFEKDYNELKIRLETIKTFYSSQPDFKSKISSITTSTPLDIIYRTFAISQSPTTGKTAASISLIAYNEESIVNFISNIILNPDIASVSVNSIEKQPKDTKYNISISLSFKPNGPTK